ncbi:SO_0444 family Cu/Zn efflux transporter [Pseudoalteromonas sp. MM17-2]|uniref:SO_0444 family Cu/Zn efflux transporter n=1 Tax=Pseudoalteromonas sp. MM17-2 TaxID=2917753 RepID=UPI001EF6C910|nr:SO_0444 family Cu/Zn efflux transporter [Pseudoalteromonas sp. MM17-2]MCG7544559.1 SO_0444 family Cu/Zn efflux transporter [Pseudoalteromonas sp. MM17-2]
MDLLTNFWQLFVLSAPWLMLGLFLAGLINVYLPANFLQRHLGKEGFWTTVKAAFIGAPMPLCSCGVIPAAVGLRRAGASKSATTSFLVSTPETGVDSVSVSYVLLGPFMAIIRPIAAITSAITAGVLVGKEPKPEATPTQPSSLSCCAEKTPQPRTSCCTNKQQAPVSQVPTQVQQADNTAPASCCSSRSKATKEPSFMAKFKQAVHFSTTKLLNDTAMWLMIGLFFAALVQTYVPASYLSQWGSGLLAMTVMVLISIPMYICATASTPVAAGLLIAGVSPGAVLVFMLAGPATNIATLGVVGKELGKRAIVAYLSAVIGVALAFGYLTNWLVARFDFAVSPLVGHQHELMAPWLSQSLAVILLLLLLRLVWLKLRAWQAPAQHHDNA